MAENTLLNYVKIISANKNLEIMIWLPQLRDLSPSNLV